MNKVNLVGRLTKEPEVRYTQTTNKMVVSFTLATRRRFIKEGEQDADFINCIAWGKTAEFISKNFTKGQQIGICGRIQTRNYEDEKGKHYITEVVAEEVEFTGSKKAGDEEPTDVTNEVYDNTYDNDLPF